MLTIVFPPVQVSATEASNVQNEEITNDQINKLDKYVLFSEDGFYSISETASTELSSNEYALLVEKINDANSMVERLQVDSKTEKLYIDVNEKTVTIEKTGNNAYLRAYKQGKTAIKGYWWGTRIWISKSAANNISTGISIGGVFIKSNLIGLVVALGGVVLANVPGGFVFNVSTIFVPGMILSGSTIPWGFEWQ
ncbi:hypothetical protein [Enterococcus camelliae]|uniref:TMhelix containing protein n=1 Tax=Enterococcus camelliae TaxID=453959 RepID=A0ABW5TKZ9_9ENTE